VSDQLHVGVAGLHFGSAFLPIYRRHPAIREVSIADTDPDRLAWAGDTFGVRRRHASLDGLLADPDVDAIHLLTPVSYHAQQSVAVLRAGKHCACAVPMATSLDDLLAIIAAQEDTGCAYMMMETAVFSREYFYARGLLDAGEFGDLTFYRGFHLQDLDGFPAYWQAYPPMHYVTHALSPALALTAATVRSVQCLGSGKLTPERAGGYDNPFPLEAGLFRLREHDMAVDVVLSFFQTARAYTEGFSLYGSRVGLEWPAEEGGPLRVHGFGAVPPGGRGRAVSVRDAFPPDRGDLLPPEIAAYTRSGAPHGGSHPHLVHEWITSITSGRRPLVDARTAAAWTAPGICAHDSALADGQLVEVPAFATPS
jgi:predicted dehydrogenase